MIQQAALNAAVAQHLPAGLQFPPNAALGSQLAGAALLGSQNAAASSMTNKVIFIHFPNFTTVKRSFTIFYSKFEFY